MEARCWTWSDAFYSGPRILQLENRKVGPLYVCCSGLSRLSSHSAFGHEPCNYQN